MLLSVQGPGLPAGDASKRECSIKSIGHLASFERESSAFEYAGRHGGSSSPEEQEKTGELPQIASHLNHEMDNLLPATT
ncbi:hypothetical protein MUK42_19159 [Musa troglodytarum]|uniref:Uncharacterized protein n=1 Tax=Musa troglodytarum TaxID=320322 RepID=A0A9E7JXQ6_9LILI|nr:hypothetical protein MUK42_19159 [Musa troglodytarum]